MFIQTCFSHVKNVFGADKPALEADAQPDTHARPAAVPSSADKVTAPLSDGARWKKTDSASSLYAGTVERAALPNDWRAVRSSLAQGQATLSTVNQKLAMLERAQIGRERLFAARVAHTTAQWQSGRLAGPAAHKALEALESQKAALAEHGDRLADFRARYDTESSIHAAKIARHHVISGRAAERMDPILTRLTNAQGRLKKTDASTKMGQVINSAIAADVRAKNILLDAKDALRTV